MSNQDDIMSDNVTDVEDQFNVDRDTEQDSDGSAQSSDTALSEMDDEAITGLQNDALDESREDDLDRICRNWNINELTEMIAASTWRKGPCPNDDSGWDAATIKLFQELSELSKTKRKKIKRSIAKLWRDRNHNHQDHRKAIGKSWDVKQRNMRHDLRQLIVEYRLGVHDKSSDDSEEESEEEVQVAPKKKVNRTRSKVKKDKNQNTKKNRETNSNGSKGQKEAQDTKLIATSPSWPSDVSDGDTNDSLKKKLKCYWNLKEDSCRDAIPSVMRPERKGEDTRGQWRGSIETWGKEPGLVLRLICKFASKTRGKHAEVLKEFKKLLEKKVDGKTRGVAMSELVEVQKLFERRERRKVTGGIASNDLNDANNEAENSDLDDNQMTGDARILQPQIQTGNPPSLRQRQPSALIEAGWDVANATAALETAEGDLLQLKQQRRSALQTGHRATVEQASLEVYEAMATVARCKEQVVHATEKKGRVELGLDKKDGQ